MISSEEIGKRITKYRKAKGLTQTELAKRVFISSTYMSYIEKGKKNASTAVLADIAENLGITLDQLIRTKSEEDAMREEEILSIMKDCDTFETRVITKTVLELKKALRKFKKN